MNSEDHKPARFLVCDPSADPKEWTEYWEHDTPDAAVEHAQRLAKEKPGQFIDIYQHATAIRSPGESEASHADEG